MTLRLLIQYESFEPRPNISSQPESAATEWLRLGRRVRTPVAAWCRHAECVRCASHRPGVRWRVHPEPGCPGAPEPPVPPATRNLSACSPRSPPDRLSLTCRRWNMAAADRPPEIRGMLKNEKNAFFRGMVACFITLPDSIYRNVPCHDNFTHQ